MRRLGAHLEGRLAGRGELAQVPVAAAGSPLITRHGDEVARAYLDAVVATAAGTDADPIPPGRGGLNVVYTALHGVAGRLMPRALEPAGVPPPPAAGAPA